MGERSLETRKNAAAATGIAAAAVV